jgi:hypothetical protein
MREELASNSFLAVTVAGLVLLCSGLLCSGLLSVAFSSGRALTSPHSDAPTDKA